MRDASLLAMATLVWGKHDVFFTLAGAMLEFLPRAATR